jgi:hypothetical protein
VTRTFASFAQAAAEAGRSRIYGGIHFEFSNQEGHATGREVARLVLRTFEVASDTQAPAIVVTGPTIGQVVNGPITVGGQVLDNISGVALLEAQLDQGPRARVDFDAEGTFRVTPALPLDGTAEGQHLLRFFATDRAGNTAAPVEVRFTLDTLRPRLTLVTPAEAAVPGGESRLTGSADGTGSAIIALSYAIDGSVPRPAGFDPSTGAFDQRLDLGALEPGPHTLVVGRWTRPATRPRSPDRSSSPRASPSPWRGSHRCPVPATWGRPSDPRCSSRAPSIRLR